MSPESRIDSLLLLWQEQQASGHDLSAAELCRDCPELEAPLRERIRVLRYMNGLLSTPDQCPTLALAKPGHETATLPPQVLPSPHGGQRDDAGSAASNGSALPAAQVPGYEILGELGRGGMGVVYKARHRALNRLCALKMILVGDHAGSDERVRFLAEAEAIARVKHAGIVQVYDFGTHEGLPYFSLELCEGGSLAGKLRGGPLKPAEAAALVGQVARAVQAAHDEGIVHRDLKPGNVLLSYPSTQPPPRSGEGEKDKPQTPALATAFSPLSASGRGAGGEGLRDAIPKITDFGLAKRTEGGGHTQTGAVMGTPSYMAPEQAEGKKDVGPPADVWVLGALLYECLTGRPPFQAATPLDTIMQVIADEPASVRQLNRTVPVDLETICHKCLQKDRAKRYASAQALADDLRRFAEGRPIAARPVGQLERLVRWCRREPVVAGLLAAVLLVLTAGVVVASLLGLKAAESARLAGQREKEALDQKNIAETQKKTADEQRDRAELLVYAGKLSLAQSAWQENNAALAMERLDECKWNLRGWEHRHLWTLYNSNQATLRGHTSWVNSVAWSRDGKRIVSGSSDKTVKVWDGEKGQELLSLKGHTSPVTSVAWSPDGKRIVSGSGDNTVKVWDSATGQEILSLKGHTSTVWSVAWSPDGKRIVSGCGDIVMGVLGEVKIWDAEKGQEVLSLKGHTSRVTSVAWSLDGKRIVSGSYDNTVKVWDSATGQEILSLKGHTYWVTSVAWSPDGKRIVSGSYDNTVKVWDSATGQEVRSLKGHTSGVSSVAWSPDGKRIVSGSYDNTVKVWDSATGQEILSLKGHTSPVTSVAWSPDGKRIVSGSYDNTVKVWDSAMGQEILSLKGHTYWVTSVAWSADGKRIVSASHDKTLKVWDSATGQEILSLNRHTGPVYSLAWSPDGKRISGKDQTGKILTWDAVTGQLLPDANPTPMRQETEAVSPAGSQRAFIENGELKVVLSGDFVAVQKRQQARDRAFLERLARPDPAYHRQHAEQYEKSSDLFAAAFHLRRLLLITPTDDVRQRLAAVESKRAEQAKADAALREKPPAKMPYAR